MLIVSHEGHQVNGEKSRKKDKVSQDRYTNKFTSVLRLADIYHHGLSGERLFSINFRFAA